MKTGEASNILGVATNTLKNWIENPLVSHFFSPSAKGEHGAPQRLFTESDILLLNTIRQLRTSGVDSWDAIAAYLDSGKRDQEFPQNAVSVDSRTIPLPQAEQSAKAVATLAERDAALRQVEELRTKLTQVEKERDEIRERLTQQIIELNRQIGRLEGHLESRDEKN